MLIVNPNNLKPEAGGGIEALILIIIIILIAITIKIWN